MAYRVAIAISGAVSLGSYEAGVAFELVDAIGQHNDHNRDDPEKHIHIDVLTGASAGGMTATLLAQKLCYARRSLDDPYSNDLYQAWVKDVDISGLLSDRFHDNPTQALLSSNYVQHVAEQRLLRRYSGKHAPIVRHPAAADEIHLSLALSNLNGVDYAVDAFKNASLTTATGKFIQTRYQDSFTRLVSNNTDFSEFWQDLARAACACGAFPTVFAPQSLTRSYSESDYAAKAIIPFGNAEFTYIDGGTFNNYPLGMAKTLVNRIDKNPRDNESRYYFYISPNSKESTQSDFSAASANPLNTSLATTSAIFNQARFQDWILTSHYNDLLEQMGHRAQALCEHFLKADDASIEAMDQANEVFLQHLFSSEPNRDRDGENQSLKGRYLHLPFAQELLRARGEKAFEIWVKALQVSEFHGHLHDKDPMQIYTITASPEELASDALYAFVGFMEERFRSHDYNVGRRKARELLAQLQAIHRQGAKQQEHHLPLADFEFKQALPDLPNLGNASIGDVKPEVRDELRQRVRHRLNLWLKNEGMRWYLRWPTVWFANRKIKEHLHL